MRRLSVFVVSAMVASTALLALPSAPAASAATLPAGVAGTSSADILGVEASAVGISLAGVLLGHADSQLDAGGAPATTAEGANLGAQVVGVPVSISAVQQTAPPDNPSATTAALADVNLLDVVTASVIESTVHARWADACLADGQSSTSTTSLAQAGVSLLGIGVAELGASQVTTQSALTADGMRSTAAGNLAGLSLLDGAVSVAIDGTATLSATAPGLPGPGETAYAPPSVRVTALGQTVSLVPGGTAFQVTIPLVGTVSISMPEPTSTVAADGTSASASVSLLDIDVSLLAALPGLPPVAQTSLDVLPLTATATAAAVPTEQLCISDPVIAEPADGSSTNDTTPTVSGTGEPGATIDVAVDGTSVGTTTVASDGSWALTPGAPLADGTHSAIATQTIAGTTATSNEVSFTIDATAPAAPDILEPADGSTVTDPAPTVSGTGEAGATVTVSFDGVESGTAPVAADGTWSFTPSTPLAEGEHTVTATQADAAGNASPADSHTFVVDSVALAPVIESPVDGSSTNDTTPTVAGTGEAGATVTVSIDGTEVGTAAVAADGSWSLPLTDALAEGPHTVSATQADAAGNVSPAASNDFTVDLTAPDAPVIESPADGSTTNDTTPTVSGTGEAGATVTVSVDGTEVGTAPVAADGSWSLPLTDALAEGPHTVTATQADAAGNASGSDSNDFMVDLTAPDAPVIESPADGSSTNDTTPTVSGTGDAGSTVTVSIDGTEVGTAPVAADGSWSLPLTDALVEGLHTVSATQQDAAGNVSPAASNDFAVDLTAPDAPVIEAPADGSSTNDTTPTVSGTGEAGATVTVSIDGAVVGTAPVAADGSWSLPLTDALAEGPHTVTATQADAAGNESAPASNAFTVDLVAPDAPVIVAPAEGSVSADATPTVSGTGEAGAMVTVSIDGTVVGTTPVAADGAWTLETSEPLAEGAHTVTATQADAAGNVSGSDSNDFTVDLTAPDAPVIESPADGSTTNETTPTVSGTGETGATVEVSVDGSVVGTAPVAADGSWSLPLTDALVEGPHTVSATQADAAGNVSPAASNDFTVDLTAPAAPVIESPADGSTTNDTTPTVSGTGEPGATVAVSVDGAPVGTAPVAADGTWSLELTEPLADGEHTVSATQQDAAGNVSDAAAVTFAVDATAPAAPEIETPADGSSTNETTPTVSGTGEPGATVTVSVDGTVVGTAPVATDGSWSLPLTDALVEGPHTVSATQVDEAGNVSPAASNDFTVDLTAPAAPVIESPVDGSTTNETTPTVSGTGEPGATVTVSVDGTVVGTAPVAADGSWSLPLADPLAEGAHTVTATQADAAGNASGSDSNDFTVDLTAPDAPVIESPADGSSTNDTTPTVSGTGEAGALVSVSVDGSLVGIASVGADGSWSLPLSAALTEGPHTVTATQADAAGNASGSDSNDFTVDLTAPDAPVIESPADGSSTNETTPAVAGTGEPGATVTVSVDGSVVGTAAVAADGSWSLPLTDALVEGPHTVSATQADAAGNASPEASNDFTVDLTAPAAPVIESPAAGSTTNDTTPTVSGTGEAGATVAVSVDGTPVGTAPVAADGTWSLELTEPLADGEHTVQATQQDAAGNVSDAAAVTFAVDATAPAAPVIESPVDGSSTNDTTPTVSGTGEPGATVTVSVDGAPVGTAPVAADGTWSLPLTEPLADGEHTASATQADAAGNASEPDTSGFAVDTAAPAAPVIESPADGSTTDEPSPTVSGTGEAGATVAVSVDGAPVGTATVEADGTWSLPLTDPLADGEHTVSATQQDAAGNVSAADSSTFTVDTAAPAAPAIESPADGSTTNDPTPTVSGTGEAGATVAVSIDGAAVGTTEVAPDGTWSLPLTESLADGEHTVSATQADAAGNVSEAASVTFSVDATVPQAPVIESPADGSTIEDATPTVSGLGEPGATVTVSIDDVVVGTAPVEADGAWSLPLTEPLVDGEHTVSATQQDAAGNVSDAAAVTFAVDATAPQAPVIESPADGSSTSETTPTVSGTGEPGATVTVSVDGVEVGTSEVAPDGTWSLPLTEPLADGEHTVSATQADAVGNVSEPDESSFAIDTAAPAAPVIESPADGSTITDATPTVSGTGEPGATVAVSIDGAPVGTAPVAADGTWSLELTDPLANGEHTVSATQQDAAGNVSDAAAVTFAVDATAPQAPVIESPADGSSTSETTPTVSGTGEPGATVTVSVDGTVVGTAPVAADGTWSLELTEPLADGEHTVSATQADAAGNVSEPDQSAFAVDTAAPDAPVIESPADGSTTTDATPTVSGSGEPGATVTVSVDGAPVGTAVVDDDGSWSLALTDPLSDGHHVIAASQEDAAGNASEEVGVSITVDTTAPPAPVITSPVDGSVIDDSTPTVTGTGEPGATVIVTIDGLPAGIVVVDEDGRWSLELTEPLAEGDHTVGATQTDAAGNASAPASVGFTVDAITAPAPQPGTGQQPGGGQQPGSGGELPRTGGELSNALVLMALLLTLGGAVLVRTGRRAA